MTGFDSLIANISVLIFKNRQHFLFWKRGNNNVGIFTRFQRTYPLVLHYCFQSFVMKKIPKKFLKIHCTYVLPQKSFASSRSLN